MTALLARIGGWRLAYEICLTVLVTTLATVSSAAALWYPAAPWLVGLTTPVLMVLRLRFPLINYLAAAVIGLVTGGPNHIMLAVLSASLSYRVARWWQVAAGLAAAWACYLASITWEEPFTLDWAVVLSGVFAVIAVLPAAVARFVRRRRTLMSAMHRRNMQLHSQQSEIARQAQTRERARIARDLHDSLGHKLTLISLYAGMMRTAEDEQKSGTADLVHQTSTAAMSELRQILGLLGQDDIQSLVRPLSGLDELAEQARASGAEVEIVREGEARPLASITEHAAYRVIQEGLTNALRHAQGGKIVLLLRYEPDALVAGVTNTAGQRVVHATTRQGLLGLTERVRIANGMLYHGPTPDGGFRLAATLPYQGEEATEQAPPPPVVPAGADFATLMDRDRRRSRLIFAATALSIAGFLVLCGAGLWITAAFVVVDRETYDAVRIGQPESEVREQLPPVDVGQESVRGGRPVPGATCTDYGASLLEQMRTENGEMIYRFCFRDGALVDKQTFEETTP